MKKKIIKFKGLRKEQDERKCDPLCGLTGTFVNLVFCHVGSRKGREKEQKKLYWES